MIENNYKLNKDIESMFKLIREMRLIQEQQTRDLDKILFKLENKK